MDAKMARRMSRFIHLAMGAGKEAVEASGIDFAAMTPEQRDRVGVVVNTGGGGIEEIIDGTHVHDPKGPRFVSPFAIPALSGSMARLHAVDGVPADRSRDDPGRRVRDVGDRVPRRAAADRHRRVRRRPGRRIRGAGVVDGRRGAREHGRPVEAERLAGDRVAAVRRDPRRLRARRGRRRRRRRVRGARARPRRHADRRDHRRRADRRRVPHLRAGPDRPRPGAGDDQRAAQRRGRARRDRLDRRPRHLDVAQRRDRDAGDQGGLWLRGVDPARSARPSR